MYSFSVLLLPLVFAVAPPQDGVTPTPDKPAGDKPAAGAAGAVQGAAVVASQPSADDLKKRLKELEVEREDLLSATARLRTALNRGQAGRTLRVNGETLDRQVVERELLYLSGARQIQEKIIEFIIDEWIAEQIKNGADPKKFEVIEQELDTHIENTRTQWERENPEKGKFEDYLRTTGTSPEEYRTLARNTKIFDKLFFGGHPRNWPQITGDAIIASGGEQGDVFWTRFRDSVPPIYFASTDLVWDKAKAAVQAAGLEISQENKESGSMTTKLKLDGKAENEAQHSVLMVTVTSKGENQTELKAVPANPQDAVEESVKAVLAKVHDHATAAIASALEKPVAESFTGEVPPFWLAICRQWVLKRLTEWSDVRYASDGLADDEVLKVNDRVWKTADASKVLLKKAKPEDFERALVEVALRTALKQELVKSGDWLSDEEYRAAYKEYCKPYEGTPFTVEVLALTFKGYPSMEAFKQRWRLVRSFEDMIAKDVNNESLRAHIPVCKNFLGDGRINVKYIRVPAFDDSRGTWRENGWERARKEAEAAMDAIAGGMDFDTAIKSFGKFKPGDTDLGVLGLKSFNELRQKLGESEYMDFVNGYSIAGVLLNQAQEGSVIGPLRCNDGYVIAKLVHRVPPGGAVSIEDEKTRDLVKQDYISNRFLQWAGEVAQSIEIE